MAEAEANDEVVDDAVGDQGLWSWPQPRLRTTRPRPSSWPAPATVTMVAFVAPAEVAGTITAGVVAKTAAMFTAVARGLCCGHVAGG